MATNRITVDASPEDVFDVLSDAHSYSGWVVGASEVRGADASWPDARASFSHTQGVPALGLRDSTTVIESQRPRRLRLCVRLRPLLTSEVLFELRQRGSKTEITMVEHPEGGLLNPVHNPIVDVAFKLRNVETLRRLKRWSEYTARRRLQKAPKRQTARSRGRAS